ncbi:MAG: SelD-related putative sulfur metabolism protein, partial [Candidatus Binatia bacterium]
MKTAPALDRWRVPLTELREELARGQKPKEIVCLGCAAKVELVSTVYPVLEELSRWLREKTKITLQPRDDVYLFPTDGEIEITRGSYAVADLVAGRTEQVTEDVRRAKPTGLVVLTNFMPFPSRDRLKKAFFSFYEAADRAGVPFTVGKGHTIQIAKSEREEYIIAEYVRSTGSRLYGVANNDTISTIDPNLEYASWVSLFVAVNNALNDIFLSGVHRNIRVHPTVDARDPADLPKIRAAMAKYERFLEPLGIEVVDPGPLGFGTKSMGATVVGITDREVPINQRLLPGQILIATRPVGDLAPLTDLLIRQSLDEDASDLQSLREHVLTEMLTPNVEAAKIIANYLPAKGSAFDRARHVSSCRDMTGPGILAVEELAQDSGNDVYLHAMELHDERVADVEMPNPTSGTNGAIIIGADAPVAERVMD